MFKVPNKDFTSINGPALSTYNVNFEQVFPTEQLSQQLPSFYSIKHFNDVDN